MRATIWGVGLFALAVVLTLAAHYNAGYVLIAVPTHRVELSLNLAVLLVALACVAFYFVVRAAQLVLALPAKARVFRHEHHHQQSAKALEDALNAFFESRHGRAERASRNATHEDHRTLAGIVAARAAHELRNFQARDDYLARIEREGGPRSYLRLITQAELLLDERRYHDALGALLRLPEKHAAALKLELRAHQLANNWEQVLAMLPQLERGKVFEPSVLEKLRRNCHRENLRRRSGDLPSVREYWNRVPPSDRLDGPTALAAADAFLEAGAKDSASSIIEDSLQYMWDSDLLDAYANSAGLEPRRHLERAEAWLKEHPKDAELLHALGRICMRAELWGKARSYLEASLAIEETLAVHLELVRLLDQFGETEGKNAHLEKALGLALSTSR